MCDIYLNYFLRTRESLDNDFRLEGFISVPEDSREVAGSFCIFPFKKESQAESLWAYLHEEIDQEYDCMIKTCRSSPLSRSTNDPAAMQQARKWLSACETQSLGHETCFDSRDADYRPNRLLDISGGKVRLSLENRREVLVLDPYCALSYCWGTSGQTKLTVSNEENFCQDIEFATLPKTIQDAVTVTRNLKIRYIWIDSLCIIQDGDDGKDWNFHSTEMSKIYSNCLLNLSADRASTAQEGFLGQRTLPALRPVFCHSISTQSKAPRKFVVVFKNVGDIALGTEPLGSRAWVFSERLLSPRTLHFGAGEMFWECGRCIIASESCPEGYHITSETMDSFAEFEILNDKIGSEHDWNKILSSYSRLSLTEPDSDKLVALAGVAQVYEQRSGRTILAGICQEYLPHSLLWKRSDRGSGYGGRSLTYRAPSWSWANFDGC